MNTFTCHGCPRRSGFSKRKNAFFMEMYRMPFAGDDDTEQRTYECEHCGRENVLKFSAVAWLAIDLEM